MCTDPPQPRPPATCWRPEMKPVSVLQMRLRQIQRDQRPACRNQTVMFGGSWSRSRVALVIVTLALLLTSACGARLDAQQYVQARGAGANGTGGTGSRA